MQHFTYRLKEIDTDELLELSGINDSNLKYLKEIYGCDISIRNSDVLFFKEFIYNSQAVVQLVVYRRELQQYRRIVENVCLEEHLFVLVI